MSTAANPNAPQAGSASSDPSVPQEPTGPLASDSLAAESVQSGGKFSENENANISSVSGEASTFANTDTSGATTLPPATSGGEREPDVSVQYPSGDPPPQFSGTTTSLGYSGGPSAERETSGYQTDAAEAEAEPASTGTTTTASSGSGMDKQASGGADMTSAEGGQTSTNTTTADGTDTSDNTNTTSNSEPSADASASGSAGVRPYVDQAPTYANIVNTPLDSSQAKPKGTNLGSESIPETKTFTGDVGGSHDPGRVGLQTMLAKKAGEGVGGIRQSMEDSEGAGKGVGKGNQGQGSSGAFDVLGASERADRQGIDE